MKKTTIVFWVLCFISTQIYAKLDKVLRLSDSEISNVNDILTNLIPDKTWIEGLWDSKDFRNTNVRCAPQATALRAWQALVEDGQVTRKDSNGDTVPATMVHVQKITRLDRKFHSDAGYLEDVLMGLRCPLDGHLYSDDIGVPE